MGIQEALKFVIGELEGKFGKSIPVLALEAIIPEVFQLLGPEFNQLDEQGRAKAQMLIDEALRKAHLI